MSYVFAGLLGAGVGVGFLGILASRQDPDRQDPDRPGRPARDRVRFDRRQIRHQLVAVAAAATVWLVTGWPVGGVLAGLAVWALPRLLGRDKDHERRLARIEAIAAWTEMLRDTLASAAGLEQAITATAPIAPAAIRPHITSLARRLETGQRLAPALHQLADDLADPTADLMISALILATEQRARRLGDLLGSLAQATRDQAAMRMRIEAGRARTRTSVRVIVATTIVFAAGLVILNRDYLAAYASVTGQLLLLAVGGLFAAAFAWMTRIARPAQPQRFLHSGQHTGQHTQQHTGQGSQP